MAGEEGGLVGAVGDVVGETGLDGGDADGAGVAVGGEVVVVVPRPDVGAGGAAEEVGGVVVVVGGFDWGGGFVFGAWVGF